MACCPGATAADDLRTCTSAAAAALSDELRDGAMRLPDGRYAYTLSVPAVHCGNCIGTIERMLSGIPGVSAARVNLTLRRVSFTLDRDVIDPESVVGALEDLGYPARPLSAEATGGRDAQLMALIRALAISGFAAANVMLLSVSVWNGAEGATRELFHFISALIAIPAVAVGGLPFFRSAAAALRRRRVNMDVPISLGVLLATGMSLYESLIGGGHAYFDAAVSLLFFLLIGRTLDHLMRAKARLAAERLSRLAAKGGLVVDAAGNTAYHPLHALVPGMIIRVSAGERFPVDGTVIAGASDADRSLVTGESEPARLEVDSPVEAGTLNLTGAVDMRADRAADQSFLAQVTAMMGAAEQGRGVYERIADRMARIYAPAVHILSFGSFLGWMLWTGGDWHQSLTVAVAVLIITCPCALGLAVPAAHVVAAERLFAAGILVKDGSGLERLATVTDVVFDKTGTLTSSLLRVTRSAIPAGAPRAIAKALALRSVHPAARALAAHIDEPASHGLAALTEVPGHGVEAVVEGRRARLGRLSWVLEISAATGTEAPCSGLAFAVEKGELCAVEVAETLRRGARGAVAALRGRGLALSVMSGDAEGAVARMTESAGISEFSHGCTPGDKLTRLEALAAAGRRVLMVGDGLNDAPALAAAHVSMAPASATDVGRTAADFVFTRESLDCVSFAHEAAVRTARIVRQNFGLAILYNAFAVPLAMTGQLNPLIAAIAMSTSSIVVVANSLRLYRLALDPASLAVAAPRDGGPNLVAEPAA